MSERERPEDATFYGWDEFQSWADAHGVGDHPDDWMPWWGCWKNAYVAALNCPP